MSDNNAALLMVNTAGGVAFRMDAEGDGKFWNFIARALPTGNGDFVINNNDGPGSVEFKLNGAGDLTLEGEIITNSCPVGCAPDFVFEPDYELMPLGELEAYIKEHKHLPNVQSAEQMTEDGIKLTVLDGLARKAGGVDPLHPPATKDQRGATKYHRRA